MGSHIPGLIEYRNVPPVIGALLSGKMASLVELQTVLGVEDAYDLLEIQAVDARNQQIARVHFESEAARNGNRR